MWPLWTAYRQESWAERVGKPCSKGLNAGSRTCDLCRTAVALQLWSLSYTAPPQFLFWFYATVGPEGCVSHIYITRAQQSGSLFCLLVSNCIHFFHWMQFTLQAGNLKNTNLHNFLEYREHMEEQQPKHKCCLDEDVFAHYDLFYCRTQSKSHRATASISPLSMPKFQIIKRARGFFPLKRGSLLLFGLNLFPSRKVLLAIASSPLSFAWGVLKST